MDYNTKRAKLFTHFKLREKDMERLNILTKDRIDEIDIKTLNLSEMNKTIKEFINSGEYSKYKYVLMSNMGLDLIDEELYELIDKLNTRDKNNKSKSNKCTVAIINFDK